MKQGVAATLIAGVAVLTLTACSTTNAGGGEADAEAGITPIGYSAVFLQDPAQSALAQVFEDVTTERDLEIIAPKSANGDAATQDSDIRSLVTAGAKSLILIPTDPSAVVPSLKYAQDNGLRTVALFQGPSGGKVDIALIGDEYNVGQQACEYLAEKVGPEGTLLHVQGDLSSTVGQLRDEGFQDCVKENYPDITLLAKTGGVWDPVTAAASVAAVLVSNPDLGGIFMASDGYAEPVAQTLASAGRTAAAGDDGHVWTISVDGTPAALDGIRNGKLDASLALPLVDFSTLAVDYLQNLDVGATIKVGKTDHNSEVKETDDGYLADVFPSTLITVDNVDDDSNWANTL